MRVVLKIGRLNHFERNGWLDWLARQFIIVRLGRYGVEGWSRIAWTDTRCWGKKVVVGVANVDRRYKEIMGTL